MIDVDVAATACKVMGLSEVSTNSICLPIKSSKGHWRLPLQECGPVFHPSRGVPQGLSASVLLAEVFISMLLWRLTMSNSVEVVAYVADVTIVATSPEPF